MITVQFSPSLGLPDMNPISCTVASSPEAVLLDKRFQEGWLVAIADLPILGQLFGSTGQNAGSKVLGGNPGKDKEAGVVEDQMKVTFPLLSTPADKAITGGNLPGSGSEAQCRQEVGTTKDKVADLCSGEGLIAEIMITLDEFIPEGGILPGAHRTKQEFPQSTGGKGDRFSGIGGGAQRWLLASVAVSPLGRGKADEVVPVHTEHGNATGHILPPTVWAHPAKFVADQTGQLETVPLRLTSDELTNAFYLPRAEDTSTVADIVLG